MGLWDEFDQIIAEDMQTPDVAQLPEMSVSPTQSDDLWASFDQIVAEDTAPPEEEVIPAEDGGIFTDIGHGISSGLSRGVEGVASAVEWAAPEGSRLEELGGQFADYMEAVREENPDWFSESISSQKARESSAWNPRGWLYGGFESMGMLAPGLAVGVINPIAGAAVTGGQFWGSTAQEAYDEAVANEKAGIGKKLTEKEKIAYANLRGFWEGGIEMIQSRIPFMKLGKFIPKATQQNIIRSAVTQPGNPLWNSAKSYMKTIAAEVPMELGQEYAGQKTAFGFGQSEQDASWDSIKAVIGPTIVMSAVLSTGGQAGDAMKRKQLHDALTKTDVKQEDRAAAIQAVYNHVKGKDEELADMWLESTGSGFIGEGKDRQFVMSHNNPVAMPLDEDVRSGEAELLPPQEGVEKLKEAQEIENAQLRAEVEAVNERKRQEAEETGQPAEIITPTGETVIEPDVAPKRTIEQIQDQIRTMEKMLEVDPNRGNADVLRQGLANLKQERAAILEAEQTVDEAVTRTESVVNEEGYEVTKIAVGDMEVAVEQPVGSTREGVDETGRKWETEFKQNYGYIEGVQGQDKEKLDVFVKEGTDPRAAGDKIFIVNQKNLETGEFDEHKVMVGFESLEDAKEGYLSNYDETGSERIMSIEETTTEGLKEWTSSGKVSGMYRAAGKKVVSEVSRPIKDKEFTLDKETGEYVYKDAKTGAEVKIVKRTKATEGNPAGWYQVQGDGSLVYLDRTKPNAVKALNGKLTVAQPETKYSPRTEGELLVEREAIPEGVQVSISVPLVEEQEGTMDAQDALDSTDTLLKKLGSILDCVRA